MKETFTMIKNHLNPDWKFALKLSFEIMLITLVMIAIWIWFLNETISGVFIFCFYLLILFAHTFSSLSSRAFNNELSHKREQIRIRELEEDEKISQYIKSSEYFDLYMSTPNDLRDTLAKILYYRHLNLNSSVQNEI